MRHALAMMFVLAWSVTVVPAQAAAPATRDWSGFYLGANAGVTKAVSHPSTVVAASGTYFITTDPAQIASAGAGSLSQQRLSVGVHGGYGKLFGNVFAGIEVSAGSLSFDDSRSITVGYLSFPGTQFTLSQTVNADWMATLRPRLGWAQDNWLTYVTAGLALTRLQTNMLFTDTAFNALSQSTASKTVTGWTAGLGAEYALNKAWSLRAEYLYAKFGSVDATSAVLNTGSTATLGHSTDLKTHSVLIGLTHRF